VFPALTRPVAEEALQGLQLLQQAFLQKIDNTQIKFPEIINSSIFSMNCLQQP
jgi:hypothetical protein